MTQPLIDAEALISMFESAGEQQREQLRKAVGDATLAALQGRELTLRNIKSALRSVSEAASTGVARNAAASAEAEGLLDTAVAGMDDALLKAVQAHRVALQQFVAQGADLREQQLSKALADLDRMEDALFSAVRKAADGAGAPLATAWGAVLEKMQAGGTLSGAQAQQASEQLLAQMQSAMRQGRAASLHAAQALAESYTAMVSGVLLGMAEAMQGGAGAKGASRRK